MVMVLRLEPKWLQRLDEYVYIYIYANNKISTIINKHSLTLISAHTK